jgi:phenylpyruvate tautomerase PptA (4-oxalocrotonate tautomerase family)
MPTVIVYWSPGRNAEQKQRVSQRIYEALVQDGGARPEDVLVIFQNIEEGDSARPGAGHSNTYPIDEDQHEH